VPPRARRASSPVVFVHGVGLGPLPYLGFIEQLLQDGSPLLVLELPFVAQRLSALGERTAPQQARTVQAIADAMHTHGLPSATFVGHSLGTVYLSWVAQLQPSLLASAVFLDPIVFLLHQPKVAFNFLYAEPQDTLSAVEHYFIKSEHSIVHFFHHHFVWWQNVLWAHDLRQFPTEVVLSRRDAIVPVEQVSRYLRRAKVPATILEGRHGEFLSEAEDTQRVLAIVRKAQRRGRRRPGLLRRWQRARRPSARALARRAHTRAPDARKKLGQAAQDGWWPSRWPAFGLRSPRGRDAPAPAI